MSLDFKYTCPEIDNCISRANEAIELHIDELLKNIACDGIPVQHYTNDFIRAEVNKIISSINPLFEDLRTLNSKMRDAADEQLGEKDYFIISLKEELESLEATNSDLESIATDLEIRLSELENLYQLCTTQE